MLANKNLNYANKINLSLTPKLQLNTNEIKISHRRPQKQAINKIPFYD